MIITSTTEGKNPLEKNGVALIGKEWQIIEGVKLESDMGIFPLIIPVVNHKCLKWAVVHTKTERMGRFKIGRGEEGMKERE